MTTRYDLCPDLFMIYILGRIRVKKRWERGVLTAFVTLWMARQTYLIVVEHNPALRSSRHDLTALLAIPNEVILCGMLLLTLQDELSCVSVMYISLWMLVWGGDRVTTMVKSHGTRDHDNMANDSCGAIQGCRKFGPDYGRGLSLNLTRRRTSPPIMS